ncbi:hypothetical protein [Aeromonas phage 3]|nr:hypothetical protein [Aeromonas phage 3]
MLEILPIINLVLLACLTGVIIMLSIKAAALKRKSESQSARITEHHNYFIDKCQALADRLSRITTHHGDLIDQHHNRLAIMAHLADQEVLYVRALARDVADLRADAEFTRIEKATTLTVGPVVVTHGIDGTSPYTIQYWLEELAQLEAEATLHGIELTIGAKLSR